ncbi:conserved hypothetical protein [Ricinus communis]|uniref:Uncharacterized protein n=1 Tax=Ricinus communis TaxID=3988 RepID=B9RWG9_RICCO|nr:conserved hypothetical protein [Ricinus communis]
MAISSTAGGTTTSTTPTTTNNNPNSPTTPMPTTPATPAGLNPGVTPPLPPDSSKASFGFMAGTILMSISLLLLKLDTFPSPKGRGLYSFVRKWVPYLLLPSSFV